MKNDASDWEAAEYPGKVRIHIKQINKVGSLSEMLAGGRREDVQYVFVSTRGRARKEERGRTGAKEMDLIPVCKLGQD